MKGFYQIAHLAIGDSLFTNTGNGAGHLHFSNVEVRLIEMPFPDDCVDEVLEDYLRCGVQVNDNRFIAPGAILEIRKVIVE